MITRYVLYSGLWGIATILGMFGGYHLARYAGIGESIWGNSTDGWCGDFAYKANQGQAWYRKYWACWWWSTIRNPVQNLVRNIINAEGIIAKIEKRGSLTVVTIEGGRRYFFYYNKGSRYLVKFGWKLWESEIKVGKHYNAQFVLNP